MARPDATCVVRVVTLLLFCGVGCVTVLQGQGASTLPPDAQRYRPGRPPVTETGFEVLPVQGGVHMIWTGTGANIVVQAGEQGALLVDAGVAEQADRVLAAVRTLTREPIKGVVNTTTDLDHIGGNERLARAGQPMFLGSVGATRAPQAPVFAHEQALVQLAAPSGQTSAVPSSLWPTETFFTPRKKFYFNREPVEFQHVPARTAGDVMVWFRRADVIASGDVFSTMTFPRVDRARGGRIQGVLDSLNRIVDLAVAEFNQQGGTRIVPSHGRIANQSDVVEYRDMVTIVRDRVRNALQAGRSLAEVKAARYTLDYDGLYAVPGYSGDDFVEAIYTELQAAGQR